MFHLSVFVEIFFGSLRPAASSVLGEGHLDGDVAEIVVGRRPADRRRQLGDVVDREGHLLAEHRGDIDELLPGLHPKVREFRAGMKGGAHDRDRVRQEVKPALPPGGSVRASGRVGAATAAPDIERDVAIQPLIRTRDGGQRERKL